MKYFTKEEEKETLDKKNKFDGDAPIEVKEYTYQSGAVYRGEWIGGMRHG